MKKKIKIIFCMIGIILMYSCEKHEVNNEKIIIKDSIKLEYEDTARIYDEVVKASQKIVAIKNRK